MNVDFVTLSLEELIPYIDILLRWDFFSLRILGCLGMDKTRAHARAGGGEASSGMNGGGL